MQRHLMTLLWVALLIGSSTTALAQEIELVYTKANLMQTLDYKEAVTYSNAKATNALSLMNVSADRIASYLSSIASHDAILIFGEGAVKAVTAIEYTVPVIIINATGETSAKGPVFRVFDADFGGAPSSAVSVSDAGSVSLSAGDVAADKQKAFKCDGIGAVAVVDKLVSQLAGL